MYGITGSVFLLCVFYFQSYTSTRVAAGCKPYMYLFKQREHLQCDHVLSEVIPQLQNKPRGCLMQCSWDDILHLQPQGLLWIVSHHKQ